MLFGRKNVVEQEWPNLEEYWNSVIFSAACQSVSNCYATQATGSPTLELESLQDFQAPSSYS